MAGNSNGSSRKNFTPSTPCFICNRGLGTSPRDALFVINDDSTEDDNIIGLHNHALYKYLNPTTQRAKIKLAKLLRLIKPIPRRRTQKIRYSREDQKKVRCCFLEMIKLTLADYANTEIHLKNNQYILLRGRLVNFREVDDDASKTAWAIKIYRQLIKHPRPKAGCKKIKLTKLTLVTKVA